MTFKKIGKLTATKSIITTLINVQSIDLEKSNSFYNWWSEGIGLNELKYTEP